MYILAALIKNTPPQTPQPPPLHHRVINELLTVKPPAESVFTAQQELGSNQSATFSMCPSLRIFLEVVPPAAVEEASLPCAISLLLM